MSTTSRTSSAVASPCISVCKLDAEKYCLGCHRHVEDIRYWSTYSDAQKRDVLKGCEARVAQNAISSSSAG